MKMFKKFGGFLALLFGVASLVMLFLGPAAMFEGNPVVTVVRFNKTENVTAFGLIFGTDIGALSTSSFNIMGFFGFLALAFGILLTLVPLKGGLKYFLGTLLFLAAGVLFFLFPNSVEVTTGPLTTKPGYEPGTTLIIAAVLSLVAFLINSLLTVLHLKK